MPSSKKGFAGLADLTSDSIVQDIKKQHKAEKPPSINTKQSSDIHVDYPKHDRKPLVVNKHLVIGLLSVVAIALIVNYYNSYPEVIPPPQPPEEKEEDLIPPNEFVWDGGNYQGDYFVKGNLKIPNGNGKWAHLSNGRSYEGQWENGDYHGIGTLIEPNRNEYIGEWENGLRYGKGEQEWFDGRYYDGDWVNNKRDGYGVWAHPDGRKYAGDWKNGVLHGEGTYEWPNGEKYIGQYQNDEKNGYGIMYYKDGSIYEGDFVDGYREGYGELTYEDGSTQKGEWIRDEYLPPTAPPNFQDTPYYEWGMPYMGGYYTGYVIGGLPVDGFGVFRWPSGVMYTGGWLNGKPHGDGVIHNIDGTKENVKFIEGEIVQPPETEQ